MANTPAPQAAPALLRYSALLFGPGFPAEGKVVEEFTAVFDDEAVDRVRSEHLEKQLPLEGGDFTIEVSSPDEATVMTNKGPQVRPPGVISRFGVRHEPHPDVAERVRAEAAEREAQYAELERYDGWLDSLVVDGGITPEQADARRKLPPEVRAARHEQRQQKLAQLSERHAAVLDDMKAVGVLSHAEAQELHKRISPRFAAPPPAPVAKAEVSK